MGLFGPSRKEFQRVQEALDGARAEGQQLAERLAQAEAQRAALDGERRAEAKRRVDAESERDALYEERDVLRVERDATAEERDDLRAERDSLTEERDALRADRDGLRAERDAAQATAEALRRQLEGDGRLVASGDADVLLGAGPGAEDGASIVGEPLGEAGPAAGEDTLAGGGPAGGSTASGVGSRRRRPLDGSWALVLADLERRWAAGTGALPAMRGVTDGPVSAQVAEAVTREVERLREEMGVDVSLITGKPVEPADPVVFLLAATDLLGALAATCERVTVTLDDTLMLTGEVWVELGDELDVSRGRALAAGALIDPLDVDDDQVRITLRP